MTKPNQNVREEFSGRTFQQGRRSALKSNAITTCIGLALAVVALPAQADEYYDDLILRARNGETAPALAMLRQMGDGATPAQRFDRIMIASWAGRADEVAEVYQRLPLSAEVPPANVQLAAARALRDLKRWPEALAAWRAGLQQHPGEQAAFATGFIMTLADAGQGVEAVRTGEEWVARFPGNVDLRMALAYAHSTEQRPFDALFHADKALQLAPEAPWVQREYILTLQRSGMARQAVQRAQQSPELLTPAQQRTLDADVAANLTRLAVTASRREEDRYDLADRALAHYDLMLSTWKRLGAEAAADIVRIRIDRLSALHTRVRMRDVVDEYQALKKDGVKLPAWALTNVASAYLYLREPEKARDLYREVLAELDAITPPEQRHHLGPANERLNNEIGLYYALTEAEQFDQIGPVLERINNYGPAWLYHKGNPSPQPNPNYQDAQLLVQVGARLAVDDLPAAQARMEAMVTIAPNNSNLRADLAGVYQARAQPRRAEVQLKLAETMSPRSLTVETALGNVAMDLQEWRQAEQLSADTIARYPENKAAQGLARRWALHNKSEIRVSGSHGIASDSPVAGRGGRGFDTSYYTSPIRYNWRLFAGAGHAQSTFLEGPGQYNWQRAGAEWRGRDLWMEGEISANTYGHGSRSGARLSAAYDLGDHWRLGGDMERLSRNSPLRAMRDGVTANRLGAYARWRAHERREWWMSLSSSRFSDDNQRWEFALDGSERVHSGAHLRLDLLFNLSAQSNRLDDDRLYFNPKRTYVLLPGLRMSHILNRRYENVWEQVASISAGGVHQRFYGTDSLFVLTYGQRWSYQNVFEAGLTVNSITRPYDGNRELETQVLFDLVSRF